MSVQDSFDFYKAIAMKALEEKGEIAHCVYHDDYFYRVYKCDTDEIYSFSTNYIKKIHQDPSTIDFTAFHDAVAELLKEAGDSSTCPRCEANITKIMKE